MSEEITPDVFAHMVELAALELTEKEAEYLRQQLNNQLRAIHELAAIPLDEAVQPSLHGIAYTPAMSPALRADEIIPCEDVEAILRGAPEVEEGYIVVPEIPTTQLD